MGFWEQIKEKTDAVEIKLRMLFGENHIDGNLFRLGSRTYDLSKDEQRFAQDAEIQAILKEISSQKEELTRLKEDFRKSWRQEAKELKKDLEKGNGALEQVEISSLSAVIGKKIKEIDLPKEVLLGPLLRDKELIIPDGDTELREYDRVTLMGKKKDIEATVKLLKGMR